MNNKTVYSYVTFLITAITLFPLHRNLSAQNIQTSVLKLDELVENDLIKNNITASDICTDDVFIRRISLDITGRQPSAEEARKFIEGNKPDKRAAVIDSLISSESFTEYQVLKWGDLLRCKSEFQSNLWPNAVQAYERWMKESIRENIPYDRFARELLISSGSNFRVPTVNFYRAFQERTPKNIAESAALIFLGMRPSTNFAPGKTTGDLAPFFTQVKYKKSDEWKEEFVYVEKDIPSIVDKVVMPDGNKITLTNKTDFRLAFADWLTNKQNPYFAKVMANRVWFWILGRGIVNDPDDFKDSNPPSNPALLSFLEKEFKDHNYDVNYLFRLILNSKTYQRSFVTYGSNMSDEIHFSHYPVHRLTAEQLIDAVCDITGVPEVYSSRVPEPFTFLPKDTRAVQLEDGTISTAVLEMFGRPSRDVSYENDRNNNLTMKQVLFLLNSTQVTDKINKSKKLKELTVKVESNGKLFDEIYLLILNRFPTKAEITTLTTYFQDNKNDKFKNTSDLVWALINTKEFLFNH